MADKDLKGTEDIKDRLRNMFHSAALTTLHAEFLAAAGNKNKKHATRLLDRFYQAVGEIGEREEKFRQRARPVDSPLSVLGNMRGSDLMTVTRELRILKDEILDIHPDIGQKIIAFAEEGVLKPPKP